MKTAFAILTASFLTLSGCCDYGLVFVTTKNESYMTQLKNNEFEYWRSRILERRVEFENDMEKFIVDTIIESRDRGILDANGIIYLMEREVFLRNTFDSNEARAIDMIGRRMRSYDDLITLNVKARNDSIEAREALLRSLGESMGSLQEELREMRGSLASQRSSLYNERQASTDRQPEPNTGYERILGDILEIGK
jgi:hypothetical protein